MEAQQLEGGIVLFQDWLSDVEAQLTARLDNDLTAHDLPDDVQVIIHSLTLPPFSSPLVQEMRQVPGSDFPVTK